MNASTIFDAAFLGIQALGWIPLISLSYVLIYISLKNDHFNLIEMNSDILTQEDIDQIHI
jgi:hypothetical protein